MKNSCRNLKYNKTKKYSGGSTSILKKTLKNYISRISRRKKKGTSKKTTPKTEYTCRTGHLNDYIEFRNGGGDGGGGGGDGYNRYTFIPIDQIRLNKIKNKMRRKIKRWNEKELIDEFGYLEKKLIDDLGYLEKKVTIIAKNGKLYASPARGSKFVPIVNKVCHYRYGYGTIIRFNQKKKKSWNEIDDYYWLVHFGKNKFMKDIQRMSLSFLDGKAEEFT